jgi:excisionase family DNA binding protein
MPRSASDWITIGEAAELLAAANVHFTTDTLARWARSGRLQSIKIGGRRYVRRGEVRGLLRPPGHPGHAADDEQPGLFEDL